eukprot:3592067-Ditylum_brightwellii.AAC.1
MSAVVVCVASSTASIIKLKFTTSSSVMGPTAYGDRPVEAVAAVGMGCPPDHFQELLCDGNVHVHIDLVALDLL